MNTFNIIREYVDRFIPNDGTMKVLLVDAHTLQIISVAYSQSQLLERGVFLVDQITNARSRTKLKIMRCIAFLRPITSSIRALCDEVKDAKFSSYSIVFNNTVSPDQLDLIARADHQELVSRVEECFADFVAVNQDFAVIPVSPHALIIPLLQVEQISRIASGLTSLCLALRRKPYIRVQGNSAFAKRIANEVVTGMRSDTELFDFKAKETVLIILDRCDDPITPLLTPWTYQAMLHEHVGLDRNKLVLPDTPAEEGFVFSQADDNFFAANMFNNFGDLCISVKTYVDQCKQTLNIDRSTATLEEIKQFMQKLPQTKHLTGSVTKHATCVSHLSDVTKKRSLLEISLLEQDMVAESNPSDHYARLVKFVKAESTSPRDALRLCLLFHIKYEKTLIGSKMEDLLSLTHQQAMLRKFREYYGERSTDQLFVSGLMHSVASMIKGISDAQNVYTQHEPLLKKTITSLTNGNLDAESFPYVAISNEMRFPQSLKPKDIIVFYVGGATFEEAALVNRVNTNAVVGIGDVRVLLAATEVLNSSTFLANLGQHP